MLLASPEGQADIWSVENDRNSCQQLWGPHASSSVMNEAGDGQLLNCTPRTAWQVSQESEDSEVHTLTRTTKAESQSQ